MTAPKRPLLEQRPLREQRRLRLPVPRPDNSARSQMGEGWLRHHASKTPWDVPDPWTVDVVLPVCDDANESCPVYPAATTRLHASFPDPSGKGQDARRRVRDALGGTMRWLAETPTSEGLGAGATPEVGANA